MGWCAATPVCLTPVQNSTCSADIYFMREVFQSNDNCINHCDNKQQTKFIACRKCTFKGHAIIIQQCNCWPLLTRNCSKTYSITLSKSILENPGIDPGTSHMRSERSTIWANSPRFVKQLHFDLFSAIIQVRSQQHLHSLLWSFNWVSTFSDHLWNPFSKNPWHHIVTINGHVLKSPWQRWDSNPRLRRDWCLKPAP